MLKYLVILLSDKSVPFCNYQVLGTDNTLMSLNTLREAVRYGMKENLAIQFIFPDDYISPDYHEIIESVNHIKVMPFTSAGTDDIGIVESWELLNENSKCKHIIIHTSLNDLINNENRINSIDRKFSRINIVIKDIATLSIKDTEKYKNWLENLAKDTARKFAEGHASQINILTDRLFLTEMRNCNAGYESITIAPDGQFYICPAFYYSSENPVGNLSDGLEILNKQLYELKNAPICRMCDAWQCKRCVWLNKKQTHEINTPGRMQCIMSHIERNVSRKILNRIGNQCQSMKFSEIPEINYLDPLEKLI